MYLSRSQIINRDPVVWIKRMKGGEEREMSVQDGTLVEQPRVMEKESGKRQMKRKVRKMDQIAGV